MICCTVCHDSRVDALYQVRRNKVSVLEFTGMTCSSSVNFLSQLICFFLTVSVCLSECVNIIYLYI